MANRRIENLDDREFTKEFYTELSHISKQYIEFSTYICALEMTTDEIIENRSLFLFDDDKFFEWINLMKKADLVKYARKTIDYSEMKKDKNNLIQLIKSLNSIFESNKVIQPKFEE